MSATGLHDLPRLAGTWVGEAEVIMPERRLRLRHHEKVETLVGGHVVTIHGWSESEDGGPAPAFEAFAVLTCDADRGPCSLPTGRTSAWRHHWRSPTGATGGPPRRREETCDTPPRSTMRSGRRPGCTSPSARLFSACACGAKRTPERRRCGCRDRRSEHLRAPDSTSPPRPPRPALGAPSRSALDVAATAAAPDRGRSPAAPVDTLAR